MSSPTTWPARALSQGALLEQVYREAEIDLDRIAFVEADDLNVPQAGPLAWTALLGALAYKALN